MKPESAAHLYPEDSARRIIVTPRQLGKLLCTVQGNDHYDTDYAPCSECQEIAEAIAKERARPSSPPMSAWSPEPWEL